MKKEASSENRRGDRMTGRLPQGLIAVLPTPLRRKALDREGLERLIAHILPEVDGIYAGSSRLGETAWLPREEHLALITIALEKVASRKPVFVSISRNSKEETLGLIKAMTGRRNKLPGKDVFLVDSPLLYHSNRALPGHYERLAREIELPLLVENDPLLGTGSRGHLARKNLRTGIVKRLSQEGTIAGLIHHGAANRLFNYRRAARENRGFSLYNARESAFLDNPDLNGVFSLGSCLLPVDWKLVTSASLQSEDAGKGIPGPGQDIWEASARVRRLAAISPRHYLALIKKGLQMLGIIEESGLSKGMPAAGEREEKTLSALLHPEM